MSTDPTYGIVISKDVMIPARDGTRLATDIFRPARDGEPLAGPWPTLLSRTSYDKSAQRYVDVADYFCRRGFAVAIQDLRGRYKSEGFGQYRHTANPHEGIDGYDTVEWIAGQPWSNARVGTWVSSHPGITQLHMALYRPPHLTAIWPDVTPIDSYDHQVRRGGAMQFHMFGALFLHAQDSQEAMADPTIKDEVFAAMERMRELVYAAPFKPGHTPLARVPALEETLFDYYTRGEYDDFWKAEFNDFKSQFHRHADIPGTYTSGWFDPYATAAVNYFAAMQKQNTTTQHLVMGPWTHMGMRTPNSWAEEVDFGPASVWGNARYFEEQLRWFNRWLKDEPTGVEDEPVVRIFVMGGGSGRRTARGKLDHGGQWRDEAEWPLARTQPTTYYLHAGGGLGTAAPAADGRPAAYTYDPAHPVPTVGGTVTGFFEIAPLGDILDPFWVKYLPPWTIMRSIVPDGPKDQRSAPGIVGAEPPYLPLAARADVLVFQTEPLTEPIELTGKAVVRLWISSSAPDTDFTAKLIDVHPANADYPAGFAMNLSDSIIRCRYRESFEEAKLMEPNQTYAVEIVLPPSSNVFMPGHRIRIDVSSSNFPRFDLNPNSGEPMGRHTRSQPAHNTVYLDAAHPSYAVFPVIPR